MCNRRCLALAGRFKPLNRAHCLLHAILTCGLRNADLPCKVDCPGIALSVAPESAWSAPLWPSPAQWVPQNPNITSHAAMQFAAQSASAQGFSSKRHAGSIRECAGFGPRKHAQEPRCAESTMVQGTYLLHRMVKQPIEKCGESKKAPDVSPRSTVRTLARSRRSFLRTRRGHRQLRHVFALDVSATDRRMLGARSPRSAKSP